MPMKIRRGQLIPGNWIIDGREVPDGCWECNLGPLESSRVPSTAEPSLPLLTNSNTSVEVI